MGPLRMTPDEAALCLRDIPDFATYSEAEQVEEAQALGLDDPLDIALAVEAALTPRPPRETVAAMGEGEECRLPVNCGGSEPVAGNGRCLTCGAYRAGVTEPILSPSQSVGAPAAVQLAGAPQTLSSEAPVKTAGVLARFKEVTGAKDKEIAELIGLARVSVQAAIAGRRPERLGADQLRALSNCLADRGRRALNMADEIHKALLL